VIIGTPKEIKNKEFRVGLTPLSVQTLTQDGHKVLIEKNAGEGSGFFDDDYIKSGAVICNSAKDIFDKSELIVKVKEPQKIETDQLQEGQILFTYLHLASSLELTHQLLNSKCKSIAYETITSDTHGLPLLMPMSEVAGRLSVQAGASCLEKHHGGIGLLLSGSSFSDPAKTLIIGGGVVGYNAALIANGMGSQMTILEKSITRIDFLKNKFPNADVLSIDDTKIEEILPKFDLVIGAVLIPGAQAPKIIKRDHLKIMKKGSVLVDVAIDQGGCFETSKATSHDNPTYIIDEVVHYCVANMPGAVPRTSTISLNSATLAYIQKLADSGLEKFCKDSQHHLNGLNTYLGKLTCKPVADLFNLSYSSPQDLFDC